MNDPTMIQKLFDGLYSSLKLEVTEEYVPERGLLAAILEMAVRDLNDNTDHLNRKSAIKWLDLNSPYNSDVYLDGFSYSYVASILQLSGWQMKLIADKVQRAKYVLEESRKVKPHAKIRVFLRDRPRTGRRVCTPA